MTASASWYDHYPLTISSYSGILGLRQKLMKNGQACNFAKKGTQSQIFFCEFYNFFRTALIQIICGWLLANLSIFTTEIPKKILKLFTFSCGDFFFLKKESYYLKVIAEIIVEHLGVGTLT